MRSLYPPSPLCGGAASMPWTTPACSQLPATELYALTGAIRSSATIAKMAIGIATPRISPRPRPKLWRRSRGSSVSKHKMTWVTRAVFTQSASKYNMFALPRRVTSKILHRHLRALKSERIQSLLLLVSPTEPELHQHELIQRERAEPPLRSASRVRPRILSLTDASTAASPHIIRRLRLATLASCISI